MLYFIIIYHYNISYVVINLLVVDLNVYTTISHCLLLYIYIVKHCQKLIACFIHNQI